MAARRPALNCVDEGVDALPDVGSEVWTGGCLEMRDPLRPPAFNCYVSCRRNCSPAGVMDLVHSRSAPAQLSLWAGECRWAAGTEAP